jgi:hypothetical protein
MQLGLLHCEQLNLTFQCTAAKVDVQHFLAHDTIYCIQITAIVATSSWCISKYARACTFTWSGGFGSWADFFNTWYSFVQCSVRYRPAGRSHSYGELQIDLSDIGQRVCSSVFWKFSCSIHTKLLNILLAEYPARTLRLYARKRADCE